MPSSSISQHTQAEEPPRLPFLKWPGGKRWLAPTIAERISKISGTYYEPFLGGGAVFFYLRPQRAVLSDRNAELVHVYRQVKKNVLEVIEGIRYLRPSRTQFEHFKSAKSTSPLLRACRFLYLNRTAFNGMYRVNQKGEFNVPYGCKPGTSILNKEILLSASATLQAAKLLHSKFDKQIAKAGKGDVVYCDPPYTVKHDNNGFIRYNESLFSWDDQVRLADACHDAAERGARVVVSNARHEPIRRLYRGFTSKTVNRVSMISGDAAGRGEVSEYLLDSG